MNRLFYTLCFSLICTIITAQHLSLEDGVHLRTNNSPAVHLHDVDLTVKDAQAHRQDIRWTIEHTGGRYFIDARTPLAFTSIVLAGKRTEVQLGQYIDIKHELMFAGGRLDLGNQILSLEEGAAFADESEKSYCTASGDGFIWVPANISAGDHQQPGKIGVDISSAIDLGIGEIRRGHSHISLPAGSSIQRWYSFDRFPTTDQTIVLSLGYRDAELNSLDENNLTIWHSTDRGRNWHPLRLRDQDINANTITARTSTLNGLFTIGEAPRSMALQQVTTGPSIAEQLHWRAFPNPVQDMLQVSWTQHSPTAVKIFLKDAHGRIVQEQNIAASSGSQQQMIDLSTYPAGTYWLHLSQKEFAPIRIVKQ